jgi:hypothetical protein
MAPLAAEQRSGSADLASVVARGSGERGSAGADCCLAEAPGPRTTPGFRGGAPLCLNAGPCRLRCRACFRIVARMRQSRGRVDLDAVSRACLQRGRQRKTAVQLSLCISQPLFRPQGLYPVPSGVSRRRARSMPGTAEPSRSTRLDPPAPSRITTAKVAQLEGQRPGGAITDSVSEPPFDT